MKNQFETNKLPENSVIIKEIYEDIERVYCLDGSLDMRFKDNKILVPNKLDFREKQTKLSILKY